MKDMGTDSMPKSLYQFATTHWNVVLMAGFVDSGRLEKMMNNGLSGFVGKPFAPVEILAVVTSVISAAGQSKEGTSGIAAAV